MGWLAGMLVFVACCCIFESCGFFARDRETTYSMK